MKIHSRIFLVGFMGSGKTTVGHALAERLAYRFVDLDEAIEARAGKSIREIFQDSGEGEFRRLEREVIESCGKFDQVVIALGGGAYESEANRATLSLLGRTVWLNCPLEICLERVAGDPSRPLLGRSHEMKLLLERRRPNYALADYAVEVGSRIPGQIVDEIVNLFR